MNFYSNTVAWIVNNVLNNSVKKNNVLNKPNKKINKPNCKLYMTLLQVSNYSNQKRQKTINLIFIRKVFDGHFNRKILIMCLHFEIERGKI